MVGQTQAVKVAPKQAAPKKTFTMERLRRMAMWGITAASALLIAVLTTRSEVGAQRIAGTLASLHGHLPPQPGQAPPQAAAPPFDAQAEARRLSEAVRGLAAESDRIKSRIAAVEHNMDDLTGSITRQIEAVRAQTTTANPWPADTPPEPATPGIIASVVTPVVPSPAGLDAPPPPAELPPLTAVPTEYGVDIGSATSIQALRARWLGMHSAHPDLFQGLTPAVVLRKLPRANRVELRLVVGPLANAEAAAKLCGSLAPFRVACQPTILDSQHIALK